MGNTFSSETHVIECQVIGGWKGWKKIIVYWKIWGKWLENHIQIAEFWLEFFLMVCGNPVIEHPWRLKYLTFLLTHCTPFDLWALISEVHINRCLFNSYLVTLDIEIRVGSPR